MDDVARLLWAESPPRRRGPRPRFTLDDVVAAAITIADREGLAAVTMQRVADELGAAKMALYRYVPGKVELASLMLDRALGDPPAGVRGRWQTRLRRWALTMHDRMTEHPWTLELALGRRTPGPHELAWLESGLRALRATPLDPWQRLDVIATITNHVRGSVEQAAAVAEPESAMAEAMATILTTYEHRFPETAAAFASTAAAGQRDVALAFGLERILDGVAAYITTSTGGRGSARG